jgi:glycosyltransferase involved in cell wall biosynthesis
MGTAYDSEIVSVIMPVYNRESFVIQAMESVRNQTYRPIELIVVDDGSTDTTAERVRDWAESNQTNSLRINVLHQSNRGASAARNHGLVQSSGEFIQFLDSDDLLHPQKLDLHVSAMRACSTCAYVFSELGRFHGRTDISFRTIDASSVVNNHVAPQDFEPADDVLPGNPTTGFYRREACVAAGPWNENLSIWDDVEYMNRFGMTDPTYCRLPGEYYFMRIHNEGRLQDYETMAEGFRPGLQAIQAIETTIEQMGWIGNISPRALVNFYLLLARRAMHANDRSSFYEAVSRAKKYRNDWPFRFRLQVMKWLVSLVGGHTAGQLLDAYNEL